MLSAALLAAAWQLVPGAWQPGQGPDGNSILIDAPAGLILVDTGRHSDHQQAILAAAKKRGKPIAAIINTHWHLDHTGGNAEVRAVYPGIPVYGSDAVDRALTGFLARSRASAQARIASGKAPPNQIAEIRRDLAAMNDLENLRPSQLVRGTGPVTIAGRRLVLHLEPYAATAGDVWIYEPRTRTAFAGDLVVGLTPFMDTACPEGWRAALARVAAAPWKTLVPGHGAPMDRAAFARWRGAFANLLDCAAGRAPKQVCVAGWMRDAAPFIPAADRTRVPGMVGYYIDTRLRAAPAERRRYCEGGAG